ncbi:MAG: type I 3-dehydroquinate dehydratase [Spirochaetaceae bacterium]|nr:MAG: type I 3-dehydroquinate dehydratase [Spirochaetaceae bacterium]
MICLSVTGGTVAENIRLIRPYLSKIDAIEFRADRLDSASVEPISSFPEHLRAALPGVRELSGGVILTVRRTRDGGSWQNGEQRRLEVIAESLRAGYSHVDLEIDLEESEAGRALAAEARAAGVRVIRSLHDFTGITSDPAEAIARLCARPGEIGKLAVTPRSTADLARLIDAALDTAAREKIVLGMGEYGFPTRVLAPRLGCYLSFVSSPGHSAAPGHIDPATMVEVYRYRDVSRGTAVFAVIGNPVMHSRSPNYHNRRFSDDRLDAVYVPIQVDRIEDFWTVARSLEILGVSVTIPHKQAVLPRLAQTDGDVRTTRACNTLVRLPLTETQQGGTQSGGSHLESSPRWAGFNTDIAGFLSPLRTITGRKVAGMRASVIGAGGAARAVCAALRSEGAGVCVLNRTVERADALKREFDLAASGGLDAGGMDLLRRYSDIIVQTTSVGMEPLEDDDPIPEFSFAGHEIVYDIVYTPEITKMLGRARRAGCPIVTGRTMFEKQAEAQYALFSGVLSEFTRGRDRF